MRNTLAQSTVQSLAGSVAKTVVLPALTTFGAFFCVSAQAQDILARVISTTPVIQQVAVQRQICSNSAVMSEAPNSGAGAVMGAIAGGAMGNAVGNGSGRALATMIGLVGGAVVGNNVEGPRSQMQNVQHCGTQTSYENRTLHYDVVYEYADKRYNIQMPNDPGQYVRLQVTPVGTLPPPAPAPVQTYQTYQTYQQYQQPNVVYTQPTTVYVQPAPVMVYPAPYPRPYYAPIGMSLNLGYSRGFGGGYGGRYGGGYEGRYRHWR
jgi:uncharacterized protein YcfJ